MAVDADYSRWAPSYDSDPNRTRDLDRQVTVEVLEDLQGPEMDWVVEAGSGTGKNTPVFCGLARRVLSIDFSLGMLTRALHRAPGPGVQLCRADLAKAWPCRSGIAGLVSFNLVLEHVESIADVFREAARVLRPGGRLFVSELHPYRQYRGSRARFVERDGTSTRIPAFVHHTSEYVNAAAAAGCRLERLDEWWHGEDAGKPPRLLSLRFRKTSGLHS